MDEVLIEQRGQLGLITLNRPQALNALTEGMCRTMLEALLRWRRDEKVRQVAVVGAGERGLCAGGDIVAIYRDIKQGDGSSEAFWRIEYQLNALISEYPKPYVALMDGIVLGGGIGISAHGSHRLITERSRCGMPEAGIGFFPDVGGTHLLAAAPRAAGRLAAMTGLKFSGRDVIELGLADAQIDSARIGELLVALESQPIERVLAEYEVTPSGGMLRERWVRAFAEPSTAAILGSLSTETNENARVAEKALRAASPSSLRLIARLLDEAGDDLRLDLRREFRVAVRRLDDPDFAEGIRAAVIDKDRTPHWVRTVDGIGATERIDRHFAPLPGAELNFALIERGALEGSTR